MDSGERLTFGHRISELFVQDDTDPRIDDVFLGCAATAELHADQAHRFGADAADRSGLRRRNLTDDRGAGQKLGLVDRGCVAALGADHLGQLVQGASGLHGLKQHPLR